MRWPWAPSRSRARASTPAHVGDRGGHRRELLEGRARSCARRCARASSCRFPAARRGSSSRRGPARCPVRRAERSPRIWRWPTNSSRRCGRTRIASGATSGSRSRAASEKRSPIPTRSMLSGVMAFEELKQRQSVVWGTGPYQNVTETLADIHELVVERLDPQPGERWLDIATGTGAVAELAARRGAAVTGIDLAPALIETAAERALEQDLGIDYRRRATAKPWSSTTRASTSSPRPAARCSRPDHAATARELTRVVKPGRPDRPRELAPRRRRPRALQADGAVPARPAAAGRGHAVRLGPRGARARPARRRLRPSLRGARLAAPARLRRGVLAALRDELRADSRAGRVARRRAAGGAAPLVGWTSSTTHHRGRRAASSTSGRTCWCSGPAAERRRAAGRDGRAPPRADPSRHGQPARERDARGRAPAHVPRGQRRPVRAVREESRSGRISSPGSRAAAARGSCCSRTRTRCSPTLPSGRSTRGRASCATSTSGGAARST